MMDEISDWLWKIRKLFEVLIEKFSKFCNPSEHLAIDEVIVKYEGRVIFRQYILKKHKRFGIKIYKLSDGLVTLMIRQFIWAETDRALCNT
jgi:hypothetical protein